MSELPISSKYRSRPDQPVPDAERDDLSARLNDAYSRGLIDQDAYRDRLDRLFAAQRLGELVPVVSGLPPRATHDLPAIVKQPSAGRPGELTQPRSATRPAVYLSAGLGLALLVLAVVLAVVVLT